MTLLARCCRESGETMLSMSIAFFGLPSANDGASEGLIGAAGTEGKDERCRTWALGGSKAWVFGSWASMLRRIQHVWLRTVSIPQTILWWLAVVYNGFSVVERILFHEAAPIGRLPIRITDGDTHEPVEVEASRTRSVVRDSDRRPGACKHEKYAMRCDIDVMCGST